MTRLIISAASADDFLQTGLPEIAMVGRSNVGKSTLINALVKEKVARTSAAPGKTQAPVAIVATKIDKLKQSELVQTLRLLRKDFDTAVLPVSTLDGRGLDDIWKLLREWISGI